MRWSSCILLAAIVTPSLVLADELTLDDVQWQVLPSAIRSVKIDNSGKPWFESGRLATVDELKQSVEKGVLTESPVIAGAKILLFDGRGRIWLRPYRDRLLLLGYNPKDNSWQERRAEGKIGEAHFMDTAWESRSGVLYFGVQRGLHVLDGDRWTYQPLYDANFSENKFYGDIRTFNPPRLVEDGNGKVFVWSRWGRYGWSGTLGFFVHADGKWNQVRSAGDKVLERLESVGPLGDALLICPHGGAALLMHPPLQPKELDEATRRDIAQLGDNSFAVREAAEKRLLSKGNSILQALRKAYATSKDPEAKFRLDRIIKTHEKRGNAPSIDGYTFHNARQRLVDKEGTAWIWSDAGHAPDRQVHRGTWWRITPQHKVLPAPKGTKGWYPDSTFVDKRGRVFFARYERGCEMFDCGEMTPVTDETQSAYRYILGEDRDGRIYLNNGRNIAAYHGEMPDRRATLPSTRYWVQRSELSGCQDSKGRIWAKLSEPQALLSVFAEGDWKHFPAPDEAKIDRIVTLQPLREGHLLAQPKSGGVAYLFDGEHWKAYKSLRELVETEYERMRELIDNRQNGRNRYAKLCVDAQQRVWVIEWTQCAVYDGQRWIDVAAEVNKAQKHFDSFQHCLPVRGGREMLVSNSGRDHGAAFRVAIEDEEVALERFPLPGMKSIQSDPTARTGLWIDSQGRTLIPASNKPDVCYRLNDDRLETLAGTGAPRLLDSDEDVWFSQRYGKKLVVVTPDGNRGVLRDDGIHRTTHIVEQRPGEYWVGTTHGLLHVRKQTGEDRLSLTRVKAYTKGLPVGACYGMYVDPDNQLWLFGDGPTSYRLWRIQLPNNR